MSAKHLRRWCLDDLVCSVSGFAEVNFPKASLNKAASTGAGTECEHGVALY